MSQIRRLCDARGTSTLEMILALPVLLFLLFGIAEISRLWHTVNLVTTASRDGARVGAATPGSVFDPGPAVARATAILAASNLTATTLTVTCASPCGPDSQVQATVSVAFSTVIPLLADFVPALGAPITVSQTTIMRRE